MNEIPTVGVLIFKNENVLLVKHGEKAGHVLDTYGIPAGRIEEGETKVQAAVRELAEETGLITTEQDLAELPLSIPPADITRKDGTIKRFSITVFLCRNYTGELISTEETIPEWADVNALDEYQFLPNTKQMIEEGKAFI